MLVLGTVAQAVGKGEAMEPSEDLRHAVVIAIGWACVWVVLHRVDADVFPLLGAGAGLIWLIVILIFYWVGMRIAQVQPGEEDSFLRNAPDEDNS
jgi:hypothetical protein